MCPDCHRQEEQPIPARIILNWDFRPRPVSRRAKEALAILHRRPLIDLQRVNPRLSAHVEEVLDFTRLRQSLIKMNTFLKMCRVASSLPNLTGAISKRPHLCESGRLVSIQDLVDIHAGTLTGKPTESSRLSSPPSPLRTSLPLPQIVHVFVLRTQRLVSSVLTALAWRRAEDLKTATANCEKHITKECVLCQARVSKQHVLRLSVDRMEHHITPCVYAWWLLMLVLDFL